MVFPRLVLLGGGHISRSAFGPFLATLTELVLLYRRARAIKYRLQRLEREHIDTGREIDDSRIECMKAGIDRPRKRQGTTVKEQMTRIDRLRPTLEEKTVAIETLKNESDEVKERIRTLANRLYDLEASVSNAVFRSDPPDIPPLPPRLYTMLPTAKAGSLLLRDDRALEQAANDEVRRSHGALHRATVAVQTYIQQAESQRPGAMAGLREAVATLERQIDVHRVVLGSQRYAKASAARRDFEQQIYEQDLFLDVAAPVLEADNRIERDRLRTSLIDHDANGERFIFMNDPTLRLTDAQNDACGNHLEVNVEEIERREDLAARLDESRDDEWQTFWTANPDADNGLFDERFEEDRLVAAEMVAEAKNATQQQEQIIVEASDLEGYYDYRVEESDGRTDSEARTAQLDRLACVDPESVDDWRKDATAAARTGPVADRDVDVISEGSTAPWPSRSVKLEEEDIWEPPSLHEEEIRRRRKFSSGRRWSRRRRDVVCPSLEKMMIPVKTQKVTQTRGGVVEAGMERLHYCLSEELQRPSTLSRLSRLEYDAVQAPLGAARRDNTNDIPS